LPEMARPAVASVDGLGVAHVKRPESPARNVLCFFKALCSCLRQERRPP
jgi:hypothetical protein